MNDRHLGRRDRLRQALKRAGGDAILVTNFTNVSYLTGFTGDDSYLLVRRDGDVLLSDFRYTTQLEEECPGLDVATRPHQVTMLEWVIANLKIAKTRRLALESDSISWALASALSEKAEGLETFPMSGLVERLREIKDRQEIEEIRAAIGAAEKAFGVLRATLRPEKTERQIRDELEYQLRVFGAGDRGFPSIVAVGSRAALPHAVPGESPVGCSNLLLVDWGARNNLYRSDLTRVLVTGRISPKLERIYRVVLRAQLKAIEAIRPGATGQEIDAIARGVIAEAGYGRFFGHGLGHGIGLDIHELPRLATTSTSVLKPGMVTTVEPGIYIPGWGGVRIEDDVLVTRDGHQVLTSVPKTLEEVVV
ncbi:MAG: M24 family metallopeptidase [Thermoguttaceae bacterium]